MLQAVLDVLRMRAPHKIIPAIVSGYPIKVPRLQAGWAWTSKRCQYKVMYQQRTRFLPCF